MALEIITVRQLNPYKLRGFSATHFRGTAFNPRRT
jgi:hypothetical protein